MTDNKALAVIPRSMPEIQSMAEVLAKSTLLPEALRNKVPDVVVQIMTGAELGLSPMASIRGVHIVQGRPVLAADTMMGLVLSSGLAEYFSCTESSATSVTFVTKRKGSPYEQKCTWSIEDAKRAGLHMKDNFRLHPRQMLAARAKAELARLAFPDVLAGCYDPDEIVVPASRPPAAPSHPDKNDDVQDAEIVTPAPSGIEVLDQLSIETTNTADELRALAPEINKLTGQAKVEGKRRYTERMAWLAKQATGTTNGVSPQ